MKIICEACKKDVATEDKRRRQTDRIKACNGAELDPRLHQALRIKCRCGCVTILVREAS